MAFGKPCWAFDDWRRRVRPYLVRVSEQKHGEHCIAKDGISVICQQDGEREYETEEPMCGHGKPDIDQNPQEEVAIVAALKACAKHEDIGRGSTLHAHILKRGLLKNSFISNALVNLYAKCGALTKAQQVFDELSVQTVVSWTTLISGYSHHGYGEKALACFDRMQVEGFSPNGVTFLCVVKACGNMGAIRRGEELHDEIVRRGFLDNDTVLGTALVDMYAKCGAFARAQQVFEELPAHDIVLWNVLVAGYIMHGYFEEALNCFEQIKCEGLVANGVTFDCLLRACGSIGAADKGTELHEEIVEKGLLRQDGLLGAALVDMYAALGALTKAEEVFEDLPIRNVVCWNVLIAAFCQCGCNERALVFFELMKLEGVTPNEITYACMLRVLGGMGANGKGEELHNEIVRKGLLEKDIVLVTAVVDMYVKCGAVSKARQLLDELAVQDIVSWNALLAGYCQQGLAKEALGCFEFLKQEGLSPSSATVACVLKACGIVKGIEEGRMIHSDIVKGKFLERVCVLGNALVDMYGKCGALAMAQQVFDELPMHDIVSWTALIAAYSQQGHDEEALSCFEFMKRDGFSPDAVAFSCVLNACGSIRDAMKGKEIHEEISREGILEEDNALAIALLDMYAKCGAFSHTQQVFDQLPIRDVVSWNVLLVGYCEHGHVEEALGCFEQMNHEGLCPDGTSYACILKACGSAGAGMRGEEIHAEMVRGGLLENVGILGSVLVDMYAKCGALSRAQEVFDELSERDVVSWTALIAGYAQIGRYDSVFHFLNKMIAEGIEPNVVTCLVVLSACSCSGLEINGQSFFETMRTSGMAPTFEHHTCMVDLFGRAGHLSKALDVMKRMPSSNYLPIWFAFLGGCQKWGNVKLARVAFEHAIQLDEKSAVPYAFMSTIYAAAGMQAEPEKIGARKMETAESRNLRGLEDFH